MNDQNAAGTTSGYFDIIQTFFETTIGINFLAALFALLTPFLLLYCRHEIRLRRLRAIKDFLRVFGTDAESGKTGGDEETQTTRADGTSANVRLLSNPSFEFVKSKYTADLNMPDRPNETPYEKLSEYGQIERAINRVGRFGSMPDLRLLASSIGFIVLTYVGFATLHDILRCGLGADFWSADGKTCTAITLEYGNWWQIAVIGSLAFAGAYIGALRNFARSVAVFDLNSYTFLRQTIEIAASVIFTIVLFALLRNATLAFTGLVTTVDPKTVDTHIQPIWYGLAPLLGLVPQSATKFLLVRFQSNGYLNWVKVSDDSYSDITRLISLDIIDGIDYETRFRLEECGIYDVQNLAAYNPVMLHIESPFGIYQVIDWIAQAQLCHIVGAEKFLIFREFNIRTIFDLERAVMSRQSFKAFDELCAGILFMPTSSLRKILAVNGSELVVHEGTTSKGVGAEDYCVWVRQKIQESAAGNSTPPSPAAGGPAGTTTAAPAALVAGPGDAQAQIGTGTNAAIPVTTPVTLQATPEERGSPTDHVLRWIADDLHVRRLRRLWIDISESLGEQSWFLPDSIDAQRKARAVSAKTRTAADGTGANI